MTEQYENTHQETYSIQPKQKKQNIAYKIIACLLVLIIIALSAMCVVLYDKLKKEKDMRQADNEELSQAKEEIVQAYNENETLRNEIESVREEKEEAIRNNFSMKEELELDNINLTAMINRYKSFNLLSEWLQYNSNDEDSFTNQCAFDNFGSKGYETQNYFTLSGNGVNLHLSFSPGYAGIYSGVDDGCGYIRFSHIFYYDDIWYGTYAYVFDSDTETVYEQFYCFEDDSDVAILEARRLVPYDMLCGENNLSVQNFIKKGFLETDSHGNYIGDKDMLYYSQLSYHMMILSMKSILNDINETFRSDSEGHDFNFVVRALRLEQTLSAPAYFSDKYTTYKVGKWTIPY